jgi:hypothetical protein
MFIKERLFPNLDDYYRHNLPNDNQDGGLNMSPKQIEAVNTPLPAKALHLDRNKEPSLLQHVQSRSDFTPAPPALDSRSHIRTCICDSLPSTVIPCQPLKHKYKLKAVV